MALAFALAILPGAGLLAVPAYARTVPWPALVLGELLQGLPVALTTAVASRNRIRVDEQGLAEGEEVRWSEGQELRLGLTTLELLLTEVES
jgi:hypothetical protein